MNLTKQRGIAQSKWHILKTIEDIREPLGLKGTSIALLRAMISFLRVERIEALSDDAHVCFASNAALAKRAHVSIQTVERHIAKLVGLGLLSRRSSGNGKRWARRDRHGNVVLATGLSLLPLVERHAEFTQMAHTHQDQKLALTVLRDKCAAALSRLKDVIGREVTTPLMARARNLLRRQPQTDPLAQLLDEISQEIARVTGSNTEDLMGPAPEIEGHKETINTQLVKKENPKIEVCQDQMQRAFPKLCAELRTAKNQSACRAIMADLARQMNLGDTWYALVDMGPALSFMALGYLLERIDTISNHRGYAMKLLEGLQNNTLEWQSLLHKPRRADRRAGG